MWKTSKYRASVSLDCVWLWFYTATMTKCHSLAKKHNGSDGKISPKGPWKCKNTVLLEIRIWPKKKQRRPELIFFFPNNLPANMWRKGEGQSRGITSHVLAWGTTGTVDFCGGGRGIGDFRRKIVPPDRNSWRIILEKFLHRCISADKRKNYIARGVRKKIRTQTKSPILPTPLKSQMVGFEKTCAWKGLFSRFSTSFSHPLFAPATHSQRGRRIKGSGTWEGEKGENDKGRTFCNFTIFLFVAL